MGSSAASFALALLIYEATQQASALALILAANYGTNIYLAPFVGSIADYFRRRSVILICDALLAAVAMVLSVVVAAGAVNQLGVVVLLVGTAGALSACLSVSLTASMRQIRTETNLTRVNGFASLMENAPVFAGPVIGATLYSVAHPATIFVFDGLTFLAAAGLVMLVRWNDRVERRHRRLRPFAGAGEGLRWILSRSDFRYLQLSFAGINFMGGTGAAVLPAYVIASSTPAASQWNLALVNTSSSVGLLLGAGLVVVLATVVGRRWLISCGVCGAALGRLGLALTAIPWLWASAGCFRNAAIQGSNASLTAIWQERTPVEVQGTVFGARRLLGQGPFPLAVLLGGLIADYVVTPGAPAVQWAGAVFSQVDGPGGALAILLALLALPELIIGLFLLRSGALRRLSLVSEVAAERPVQTTRDQVGEVG